MHSRSAAETMTPNAADAATPKAKPTRPVGPNLHSTLVRLARAKQTLVLAAQQLLPHSSQNEALEELCLADKAVNEARPSPMQDRRRCSATHLAVAATSTATARMGSHTLLRMYDGETRLSPRTRVGRIPSGSTPTLTQGSEPL